MNGDYQVLWGTGIGELLLNGYKVPAGDEEKILWLDGGHGCTM